MNFTHWLVTKTIKNHEAIDDPDVRMRYGMLEGFISIAVNIVLFIVKLVVGLTLHSVALVADAIHSLSDSASSIMIIVGFKIARKPSDVEHPFGHGRAEAVLTLILAVFLTFTALGFLMESVESIMQPRATKGSWFLIGLILATVIVKEWIARFSSELGRLIDSKALAADAWHHRSDSISTALVIVAMIAARWGWLWVDGVMGCFVVLLLLYASYEIGRPAIDTLLGEPPSAKLLKDIAETAKSVDGVEGIHDIIYQHYGTMAIISLHIEVDDSMTPMQIHTICEKVEWKLGKKFRGTIITHADPINRNHPMYEPLRKALDELAKADERISSFHELRIIGESDHTNAVFDLVVGDSIEHGDARRLKQEINQKMKEKFPEINFAIQLEPKYVYNV